MKRTSCSYQVTNISKEIMIYCWEFRLRREKVDLDPTRRPGCYLAGGLCEDFGKCLNPNLTADFALASTWRPCCHVCEIG